MEHHRAGGLDAAAGEPPSELMLWGVPVSAAAGRHRCRGILRSERHSRPTAGGWPAWANLKAADREANTLLSFPPHSNNPCACCLNNPRATHLGSSLANPYPYSAGPRLGRHLGLHQAHDCQVPGGGTAHTAVSLCRRHQAGRRRAQLLRGGGQAGAFGLDSRASTMCARLSVSRAGL